MQNTTNTDSPDAIASSWQLEHTPAALWAEIVECKAIRMGMPHHQSAELRRIAIDDAEIAYRAGDYEAAERHIERANEHAIDNVLARLARDERVRARRKRAPVREVEVQILVSRRETRTQPAATASPPDAEGVAALLEEPSPEPGSLAWRLQRDANAQRIVRLVEASDPRADLWLDDDEYERRCGGES